MVDINELKIQFKYDEITGVFTRLNFRDCHFNLISCNYTITGDNGKRGYKRVSINGKRYLLHKLAILYTTGKYPEGEVDHIDGDTSNNSIANLRDVGKLENRKNLKLYKNNKSGHVGVGLKDGKYFAQAQCNNIFHFRGYFTTLEEAIDARLKLNVELNFHDNHGEIR